VKGERAAPTNVWLLYQLIRDVGEDGLRQLKYYHAGVGTTGSKLGRMWDGATGSGLGRNMRDCYRFLVENYEPGDHVYLFGFSRGAYTVRTLAGMIRNSGIIDRGKHPSGKEQEQWAREAYDLYRERGFDSAPNTAAAVAFRREHSYPDFCISCIGVWDTVGALGIPVECCMTSPIWWYNRTRAGFHDVTLSSYVDFAFQALSVDERRGPFRPTLWNQQPHAKQLGQVLQQTWFTGVHSDVGGGYSWEERGLANTTLRWMVNRVRQHLKLSVATVPFELQENNEAADVVLHNSMSWYYRLLDWVGATHPHERIIDEGLAPGGRRVAGWKSCEEMHPCVDTLRETYATQPFRLTDSAYAPRNVQDFHDRHPPGSPPDSPPRGGDSR
jgi:uncharacterized protein (DUF2235 family)